MRADLAVGLTFCALLFFCLLLALIGAHDFAAALLLGSLMLAVPLAVEDLGRKKDGGDP